MKIAIGTDHAGFEMKQDLMEFLLAKENIDIEDKGAFEYTENDDYPDFVAPVAKAVSEGKVDFGIVIGGSGQGEAIVANKFPGVRAIVFNGYAPAVPDEIKLSREHNDANIISLGARFLSSEAAKESVDLWLNTKFSGEERHTRRIKKIQEIEDSLGFRR